MAIKLPQLVQVINEQPFSINEFIQHIRAEPEDYPDGSIQHAQIQSLLIASIQWVENYTGHKIRDAIYRFSFDRFPALDLSATVYPVIAVESLSYRDKQAQIIDLLPDVTIDYTTDCLLVRHKKQQWPSVGDEFNSVVLTVHAGYDDQTLIPEGLKIACFLMAAHLHENASATAPIDLKEVPFGVKAHADIHRVNLI